MKLNSLDDSNLGKYNSNDRAYEVLDDIQKEIKENTDFSIVFTMPQD